jgi:hypothetical protein
MELEAWHDFHVIVGGSAAALVGLTFVVIAIAPDLGARSKQNVRAFISPTVGFFSSVLVIAALMTMPASLVLRGIAVACVGATGAGQLVIAHVPRQLHTHEVSLGLEDLLCYLVLPLLTYLAVLGAGVALAYGRSEAPTVLGGAVVALLALGLRNAWDLVTFLARMHGQHDEPSSDHGMRET